MAVVPENHSSRVYLDLQQDKLPTTQETKNESSRVYGLPLVPPRVLYDLSVNNALISGSYCEPIFYAMGFGDYSDPNDLAGCWASWHLNGDGGPWLKDNAQDGLRIFGDAYSFSSIYNGGPSLDGPVRYRAYPVTGGAYLEMLRLREDAQDMIPLHIHWGMPSKTKDGPINNTTHANISALLELEIYPGTVPFTLAVTIHRLFGSKKDIYLSPTGPDEPYDITLANRAEFISFLWDGEMCSVWQGPVPSVDAGGVKLFNGSSYLLHGDVIPVTGELVRLDVASYAVLEWQLSFPGDGPFDAALRITDFCYNLYCSDPNSSAGGE